MPSFQETSTAYTEFWDNLTNNPGLDLDAEAAELKVKLQEIYNNAKD